jgi:hypothetical protein
LREFGECCREAKRRWDVGGKFVVAAAEVLHERVARSDPRRLYAAKRGSRPLIGVAVGVFQSVPQ